MDNPKVTVLMAVYNGGNYMREAVDSIITQDFKDFELLIINDGSTDGTAKILDEYKDSRITVINNEKNIGLTTSLNRGLKSARGKYVARMDADDVSMPDRLGKQVRFLDANPGCAVVGTFAKLLDKDSKVTGVLDVPIDDGEIRKHLVLDNCLVHGSAMMRRRCLLSVGPYDESMVRSQDYELWLRLSEKYRLAAMPEYLYMIRQHGGNIGINFRAEQLQYVQLAKSNALNRRLEKILSVVSDGGSSIDEATRVLVDGVASNYVFLAGRHRLIRIISRSMKILSLSSVDLSSIYAFLVRLLYQKRVRRLLIGYKGGEIGLEEVKSSLKAILGDGLPYSMEKT